MEKRIPERQRAIRLADDLPEERQRECGRCILCCKIMAVPQIDKPELTWCKYLDRRRKYCKKYDVRPKACREFNCLWLMGMFGENDSPENTNVVFSVNNPKGDLIQCIIAFELYAGAANEGRAKRIIQRVVLKGVPVIIVYGDGRNLLLPDGVKIEQVIETDNAPTEPTD